MWLGSRYIGLQEVLTIVQILFFLVTGTVVILTYVNARKSLLNPVHTEYQKLVINKLRELSEELYSEFDPESPNYWSDGLREIKKPLDESDRQFELMQRGTYLPGKWDDGTWREGGLLRSSTYDRNRYLARSVKADPFIPPSIRRSTLELLEARARAHFEVEGKAIERYRQALLKGGEIKKRQANELRVRDIIFSELYKRGFGPNQVEEKVNDLRLEIQQYLESFSPHR